MAGYNTLSSISQHCIANSSYKINNTVCGMKYSAPPPDRKSSHIYRIMVLFQMCSQQPYWVYRWQYQARYTFGGRYMSILNVVSMTSTHFCAQADEIKSARTVSTIGIHYCRPNFSDCACSFLNTVISKDMLLLLYSKYGCYKFLRACALNYMSINSDLSCIISRASNLTLYPM